MIEVVGLTKSFYGQRVLEDINLTIPEGEILVVLGESGTGKSVLLKHLVGLLKPDSGRVLIDNRDITLMSERDLLALRKNIGFLFQEGALYDFMDVFDNIAFPLREHTTLGADSVAEKVRDLLNLVGLEGVEKKFPSELSGGMKKRVALARSVILDSRILLCDEPTSGLDPLRSRDISLLIQDISRKLGCTTVVTSHDITNAFRIADRVALVHHGRIAALGRPQEIKASADKFVQEFVNC